MIEQEGLAVPAAAVVAAVAAAKGYLRVAQAHEDVLLGELAASAIRLCEQFCGVLAIVRPVQEVLPAAGEWRRLTLSPVLAITLVEGLPAEGAAFALPVGAYAIDIDANGGGWVRVTQPGAAGRVRVSYTAGLAGDWDGVPEPLRQGVVRLIAHLFAHRDGKGDAGPPAAVAALWRPFRRMRVG